MLVMQRTEEPSSHATHVSKRQREQMLLLESSLKRHNSVIMLILEHEQPVSSGMQEKW